MAEKQPEQVVGNDVTEEHESSEDKRGRMVAALDEIERRIESLREHAGALEQEKEGLLCALQMLADNQDLLTFNQCW